jgi:hypothetical protein
MEINKYEKQIIDELLLHDLSSIAYKLDLIEKPSNIEVKKVIEILNLLERLTHLKDSFIIKEISVTIIGLMWEHKKKEWFYIVPFLTQMLSRLNLLPSASMINQNTIDDKFIGFNNLLAELRFASNLIKHSIRIQNNDVYFSEFQKKVWYSIDEYDRIGISAPTSAGKSFSLCIKLLSILNQSNGNAIYVVPTITLINQVSRDLRNAIKKYGFSNFHIVQSYSQSDVKRDGKYIYVMTQERTISAINQNSSAFFNLDVLIIDEVQNIERVANEDNDRSRDLYELIHDLEQNYNPRKIIIAGPRLKNINDIALDLFNKNKEYKIVEEHLPPVVNLTYSFIKKKKSIYLNQYISINKYPQSIKLEKNIDKYSKLFGKMQYKDEAHSIITSLLEKLNNGSGTLVFSPTKKQAAKSAIAVAALLKESETDSSLDKYICDVVHPDYSMVNCIRKGVAFHHAAVPDFLRIIIEKSFSEGILKTIFCTTTLLQGVNLPAKNIIARNPKLGSRKNSPSLTDYEFANLRGRAGRLMKDFVGRAIILDESSFFEDQTELFEYPEKEVTTGYKARFEKYKEPIIESLKVGEIPSEESKAYSDLIVYIRQMIIKYGQASIERLRRTGVIINADIYKKISIQLEELKIPKELCSSNLHWDPLVLESIFIQYLNNIFYNIPSSPFDNMFVRNISFNINLLNKIAPYYYKKYFNYDYDKVIGKILIIATEWCKEIPLKDIIKWKHDVNSEEVDNILSLLNKDIVYSLPKLLKPLVQMQDISNPILSTLEFGAHTPLTRKLIEVGIPREIAIKLKPFLNNTFNEFDDLSRISNERIKNILNTFVGKLNKWDRLILSEIYN